MYPEFAAQVEELSGIDVEYSDEGALFICTSEQEQKHLDEWRRWQAQVGLHIESITADALRTLEPGATGSAFGAVLVPDDRQVENRRLVEALDVAIRRAGVEVIEGCGVDSLAVETGRIDGVICAGERRRAGVVVLAAGSWSSQLVEPLGLNVSVTPARGQVVALKGANQPVRHVIHSSRCYIVPRRDGRLLIGATVEYVGFDKKVTAGGVASLLGAATSLIPDLRDFEIADWWSGLRPDTPDHLPIMGLSGIENLVLATGHFRSGILLAPVTAELIARLILDKHVDAQLAPFSAERFASSR
jgi:glycine oxidase